MYKSAWILLFYCGTALCVNFPELTVHRFTDRLNFTWSATADHGVSGSFTANVTGGRVFGPFDATVLEQDGFVLVDDLQSGVLYTITFDSAITTLATFTERTLPGAPTVSSAMGVDGSPEVIRVQWTPAADSNQDSYVIYYTDATSGTENMADSVPGGETSKDLTGLTPGERYTVKMKAVAGSVGNSQSSAESNALTASTYPNPVTITSSTSDSVDTIDLQWSGLNGMAFGFVVEYTAAGASNAQTKDVNGSAETTTELTGLIAGTEYSIVVVTVSSYDNYKSRSQPVTVTTEPTAVTALEVNGRTSSSLNITWSFDPANPGTRQRIEVTYWVNGDSPLTLNPPPAVDATSAHLSDLNAGYEYTVRVVTTSGGVTSDEVTTTGFTIPSTPIVTVTHATETTLTLSINGVSGRRDSYTVTHTDMTASGAAVPEPVTPESQGQTTTHVIQGLSAGHDYSIQVRATSGDQSAASTPITDNTAPSPVVNVTVNVVSAREVHVEWADVNINRDSVSVTYKSTGSGADPESTNCAMSGCIIDVSSAGHPGTEVSVFVSTVKGARTSSAATGRGNTMPLPPESLQVVGEVGSNTATLQATKPDATVVNALWAEVNPPTSSPRITNNGNVYTVELQNLMSGQTYNVTVYFVVGDANVRSDSRSITIHTKPPAPGAMYEEGSTINSLTVGWPAIESTQGTFTVYRVKIDPPRAPQQNINEGSDNLQAMFNNLESGESYTVTLTTVLVAGGVERESEPSSATFITNPRQAHNMQVQDVGTNSLRVTWTRPQEGDYDGYYVTRGGGTEMSTDRDTTFQVFGDLSAGTSHEFTVYVRKGAKRSDPITSAFYTRPTAPVISSVDSSTNSIEVQWESAEGDVTGYTVSRSIGDQSDSDDVLADQLSHTFSTGILASSDYTITVAAYIETQNQGILPGHTTTEHVTTEPKAPRNLMFVNKTTSRLRVTWQAPDHAAPVTGYTVVSTVEVGRNEIDDPEDRDITRDTETTYTGLLSGGTYRVSVKAYKLDHNNDKVYGAEIEDTVTMKPSMPGEIRLVGNPQATLIRIAWNAAQPVLNGYIVRWRAVGTTPWLHEDITATSYDIDNLNRGQSYEIEVMTRSGGETSDARSTTITTVPDGTNLNVAEVGSHFIKVTWTRPRNTTFDRYSLRIDPNPSSRGDILVDQGESLEHTFTELEPGRTYAMTIAVVSNMQETTSTLSRTTEPLPVHGITVNEITQTSVRVSWQVNGSSTQDRFVVTYKRHDLEQEQTVSSGQFDRSKRLSDLSSGYNYTISVHAVSNDVSGNKVSLVQATKPSKVTSFVAEGSLPESADLTWTPEENVYQENFRINYIGQTEGMQKSKIVSGDVTALTIDELYPGDRYTYTIIAITGDEQSDASQTSKVQTPKPPVGLQRGNRDTQSLEITWTYDSTSFYADEFFLQLTKQGETTIVREEHVASSQMSVTFSDLIPGQTYKVQVYSETFEDVRSSAVDLENMRVVPKLTADITENTTTTTTATIMYGQETEDVVLDKYRFTINDGNQLDKFKLPTEERRVLFDDLVPGTLYLVSAYAVSGDDDSAVVTVGVLTNPEAPSQLECNQETNRITLIIRYPVNGLVNDYIVNCDTCAIPVQTESGVAVNTDVEVVWSNLQPFHSYVFTAVSRREESGNIKRSGERQITCETDSAPPGPVESFTYDQGSLQPYQVLLVWLEPRAKNGNILKYTISYSGRRPGKNTDIVRGIEVFVGAQISSPFQHLIQNLKGGFNYTFQIYGTTEVRSGSGDGHVVTQHILTPLLPPDIRDDATTPAVGKTTHESVVVTFTNPFSSRNGELEAFSVIVSTRSTLPQDMVEKTWADVQGSNNPDPYVAIFRCSDFFDKGDRCEFNSGVPITYRRKRQASTEDQVSVVIGSDSGCSKNNRAEHCNGPLRPDTTYYMFLRGYTDQNTYRDSDYIRIKTGSEPKEEGGMNIGLIVGIIVPIVVVIAVVIVVVVVLRRRGVAFAKRNDDDFINLRTSKRISGFQSRPVKISEFAEHVADMSKDSDFLFAEEYEDLKEVGKEQAWDASMLPVNRPKNRFTNILPYDHSRVKLLPSEDEEGSDYINANWMPGFNSKREFICSQGPLPSTIDDFWRMVWEQNCRAIVMLTRCVEKGREKCAHYWPVDSEPMFYGDVQVEIHKEVKAQEWVITEFSISKGETMRRLTHFHYIAWPDFDVPKVPQSLLRFVRTVRSKLQGEGGPTVVHCSAGVGRSGTFIVVDRLLQHLGQKGAEYIDIHSIVHEMRRFRCWMVQTESQYIFIHRCLLCVIEGQEHENLGNGEENPAFEESDEGIHIVQ